ncbi:hypothetical protein I79_024565 [Cricetulus griseus]|uniref:Uncharacterized protein n=1 Tax=Cricetulus griseus TaxID=10029 RepID=G3IL07_CRIGR|nr:hypothetical protein I79_024565 [Cricetulus griseus]
MSKVSRELKAVPYLCFLAGGGTHPKVACVVQGGRCWLPQDPPGPFCTPALSSGL